MEKVVEKFFEYAYDKIFLRDILSYITPGTLVTVVVLGAFGALERAYDCYKQTPVLVGILGALVAFLIGLSIQAAGTLYSERDSWILLRFYPDSMSQQSIHENPD